MGIVACHASKRPERRRSLEEVAWVCISGDVHLYPPSDLGAADRAMHELASTGRARTLVAAWRSRVGLGARHADGTRLRSANGRLVIISLASVEMGVRKGHDNGGGGRGGYGQRPIIVGEGTVLTGGRGGRRRRVDAVLTTRSVIQPAHLAEAGGASTATPTTPATPAATPSASAAAHDGCSWPCRCRWWWWW